MMVVMRIVNGWPASEPLTTSCATGCSTMNSNGYSTTMRDAAAVTVPVALTGMVVAVISTFVAALSTTAAGNPPFFQGRV